MKENESNDSDSVGVPDPRFFQFGTKVCWRWPSGAASVLLSCSNALAAEKMAVRLNERGKGGEVNSLKKQEMLIAGEQAIAELNDFKTAVRAERGSRAIAHLKFAEEQIQYARRLVSEWGGEGK